MAPHRLIASFVLLLLLPAAAIVWLGVRLLAQDRSLESRQLEERRGSACDRVLAALEQALAATERRLGSLPPEDDAVQITFAGDRIDAHPPGRLLYYPVLPGAFEAPASMFAAGEDLEFRIQDYRRAAAAFQTLALSPVAAARAGALLRLARNLRKMGEMEQALDVYTRLGRMHEAWVT